MRYEEFIKNLSQKDKENYEQYSKIRGKIIYKIIYDFLSKSNNEVTYSDVNSLVIYDKALKDKLFSFLAVIEEELKSILFENYDLNPDYEEKSKDKKVKHFDDIRIIKREKSNYDITDLYKNFYMNFSDIIAFLKTQDIASLEKRYTNTQISYLDKECKELRNKVMHHIPLLFNLDGTYNNDLKKQISAVIELLPINYKEGFKKNINLCNENTRKNLNIKFHKYVMEDLL